MIDKVKRTANTKEPKGRETELLIKGRDHFDFLMINKCTIFILLI